MNQPQDIAAILAQAQVPEHSCGFMQAVSGGAPMLLRVATSTGQADYVCYHADDWLTLIGYPVSGSYSHEGFLQAKSQALQQCHARHCFAIAPHMPPQYKDYIQEEDVFYTLASSAQVPPSLRRVVRKAQTALRIEEACVFTPAHRHLWTEFLGRKMLTQAKPKNGVQSSFTNSISFTNSANSANSVAPMSLMVRKLFLATPNVLQAPQTKLRLLNAWDAHGHLAACLLVDFAPKDFCAYILGAHSRLHYTAHAADALFAFMLQRSQEEGKQYIHLGLGVNEGITRFKKKWGGQAAQPFVRAAWQETQSDVTFKQDISALFLTVLGTKKDTKNLEQTERTERLGTNNYAEMTAFIGQSKRQIFASFPEQRPYAMLWKVQKGQNISWIGGSAHFFCYSFERSFRELFDKVDTVLFEGPLDAHSLQKVEAEGKTITPDQQPLLERLSEREIRSLERMVRGPEGTLARLLNMQAKRRVDVRWYLAHTRPWSALFTLWTSFLERKGWQQSVDLEAWNIAHALGKNVVAMESLEEQLASLNSVPPERVVRYFQSCSQWPKMIEKNVRSYLRGDLLQLMGTSAEFPTRTHTIISVRDERFRRRMRSFLEQGRAAVFVGTAHMLNLRNMLAEDGFTVTQVQPTWRHKLRYMLRASMR